jgi:hypothetical protein
VLLKGFRDGALVGVVVIKNLRIYHQVQHTEVAPDAFLDPEGKSGFGAIIPWIHITVDQRNLAKIQVGMEPVVSADTTGRHGLARIAFKHHGRLS